MRTLIALGFIALSGCVIPVSSSGVNGSLSGSLLASSNGNPNIERQINAIEDASFGEILNNYRATVGSQPVTFDARLNEAAQQYANVLAADPGYMSRAANPHVGPDGSTALSRIQETGYNAVAYAENLGGNQQTEQSVLQAWQNSTSHDANLKGAPLEEFGLGLAEASGGQTRWVLLLGTER